MSEYPTHRHVTEKEEDFVLFTIKCEDCGMVLFEFVHKQAPLTYSDHLMAIPDPNPPYGAQSWYKPAVRVMCNGSAYHGFVPAEDGVNRNQVCTSRGMTGSEFKKWFDCESAPPSPSHKESRDDE